MLKRRTEDYLETIYEISKEKGFARVKDIATRLKVKPASVSEMLQKLAKNGYVIYEKRLFVMLTEKGLKTAVQVKERRETIIKFLETIGVPTEIAERDACIMEHVLHPETLKQLKNFVRFIEFSPRDPLWLKHFKEFCKTGEHPCQQLKNFNV